MKTRKVLPFEVRVLGAKPRDLGLGAAEIAEIDGAQPSTVEKRARIYREGGIEAFMLRYRGYGEHGGTMCENRRSYSYCGTIEPLSWPRAREPRYGKPESLGIFMFFLLWVFAGGCAVGDGYWVIGDDTSPYLDEPIENEKDSTETGAGDTGREGTNTDSDTDTIADWAACSVPSDCVLRANNCCGACGAPTINDLDGVNKNKIKEHFSAVCDDPSPICPGCPFISNPELLATCDESGQCRAVDIGAEDIAACNDHEDCIVRTPACCECGADMGMLSLVAIRADARDELEQIVCDPNQGCAECIPVYPETVIAFCDEDKHCALRFNK